MNQIIDNVEKGYMKDDVPEFEIGDTVDVHVKIVEGDKERVQIFSGTVIGRKGSGMRESFTVRRIVQGQGVERVFPIHSPSIVDIKVRRKSNVRRSKLYFLRDRRGKSARLKERRGPAPKELFLNARGGSLTRMGFWKILRRCAQRAGLEARVHPHLLRHTYATHLLRGGAPLRVVQELLGHARLATTQIYTSVDADYLQSMHARYHPRG